MSDLISRSKLIEEINELLKSPYANQQQFGAERRETIEIVRDLCVKNQPTAYSVDKVIAEIEKKSNDNSCAGCCTIWGQDAIEIVKQSGLDKDCNNCANYTEPDEVDNGCYLCCKGYENNYEPKVDNDGASDEVCEWERTSTLRYKTSCGYKLEEYFDTNACYCKQCGKKIKVAE